MQDLIAQLRDYADHTGECEQDRLMLGAADALEASEKKVQLLKESLEVCMTEIGRLERERDEARARP